MQSHIRRCDENPSVEFSPPSCRRSRPFKFRHFLAGGRKAASIHIHIVSIVNSPIDEIAENIDAKIWGKIRIWLEDHVYYI